MGERKERSDKKIPVSPSIDSDLYEMIDKLAFITNQPMKQIGEDFVIAGLMNRVIIDEIKMYFQREFWWTEYICISAYQTNNKYRPPVGIPRQRLQMKFKKEYAEKLSNLEHALDCTKSKATALLLETSFMNIEIFELVLKKNMKTKWNVQKKNALQDILNYIYQTSTDSPDERQSKYKLLLKLAKRVLDFFGEKDPLPKAEKVFHTN